MFPRLKSETMMVSILVCTLTSAIELLYCGHKHIILILHAMPAILVLISSTLDAFVSSLYILLFTVACSLSKFT